MNAESETFGDIDIIFKTRDVDFFFFFLMAPLNDFNFEQQQKYNYIGIMT